MSNCKLGQGLKYIPLHGGTNTNTKYKYEYKGVERYNTVVTPYIAYRG